MKKITLDNRLRLLFIPQEKAKTVTFLVLVGAGSKYESKEINGVSHFLEHMLFKGTKKRPTPLEIASVLDRIGGSYNAFTDREYTGYFAKVRPEHWSLALDWVSDIFLHSLLRQEDIQRERGVVLEELNMYLDTPLQYVSEIWENLLYGDQPAGWDIIGTKETISGINQEKMLDYYQNHYSSQNTVMGIAGNLEDIEKIQQGVERSFQSIGTGDPLGKPMVVEKQEKPQSLVRFKKTDQTHLSLGVRAYNLKDDRRWAQAVLSVILGGNMSSRLFNLIREKHGLAYYVHTFAQTYTDTGYLTTQAGVTNQKVEMAVKLILEEYQKVAQQGVEKQEVEEAKEYLKGSLSLSLESSDSFASFYARQELLSPETFSPEELAQKISQVTIEDVNRLAQELFSDSKLNLALIGPYHQGDFDGILKLK